MGLIFNSREQPFDLIRWHHREGRKNQLPGGFGGQLATRCFAQDVFE